MASDLTYCDHYNGKKISTRSALKDLDASSKMVADFLANRPEGASAACQEATKNLACAMQGANAENAADVNNCNEPEVVKKPTRALCYKALESCQSKTMLREQCENNFHDEV